MQRQVVKMLVLEEMDQQTGEGPAILVGLLLAPEAVRQEDLVEEAASVVRCLTVLPLVEAAAVVVYELMDYIL